MTDIDKYRILQQRKLINEIKDLWKPVIMREALFEIPKFFVPREKMTTDEVVHRLKGEKKGKMSAYKIQLIASNGMKGTVIKSLCGREFFDTPEDAETEAKKIIEALKMKGLKYEIVEEEEQ